VLGAVVLAFAVRAGTIILGTSVPAPGPGGDFDHYDYIARSLLDGKGFMLYGHPNIHRAPGYAVFIAGVYALTGRSYMALVWSQVGLVVLMVWLVALLGRQLADERTGILAAYLAAVNPVLLFWSLRPVSEPLFAVCVLVAVLIIGPALRGVIWWRVVVAGVLTGLACLVRPQLLILPIFLGLAWLWRLKWRGVAVVLVFTVVMWIPIAPWTWRNYTVTHTFLPVSNLSGTVLWLSNNERVLNDPVYWGYNVPPTTTKVNSATPYSPVDEQLRSDREKRAEALEFLRANAEKIPLLVAYKLIRFLSLGTQVSQWKKALLFVLDIPLFPLALIGIVVLWRRGTPELAATLAVLMSTFLTIAVFWGDSRFRLTIIPYFCVLASVALLAGWRALRRAVFAEQPSVSIGNS